MENTDSTAKGLVLVMNNLDVDEAKELGIDTEKEADIWSEVAELVSTSKLGRVKL